MHEELNNGDSYDKSVDQQDYDIPNFVTLNKIDEMD